MPGVAFELFLALAFTFSPENHQTICEAGYQNPFIQ